MRINLKDVKDDKIKNTIPSEKYTSQIIFNEYIIRDLTEEEKKNSDYYLFFDQSTVSGYSLWNKDGELILVGVLKLNNSSKVDYKEKLQSIIENINTQYNIQELWYEEVYDDKNKKTTEVLYYIKHIFTDLTKKNISVYGFDHMTWKRELSDGSIKKGSEHKKEVIFLVKEYFKQNKVDVYIKLSDLNLFKQQDIVDALGMGIARIIKCKDKSYFHLARFSKNLPVVQKVLLVDDINDIYQDDFKLNKAFNIAKECGGVFEVELDTGKEPIYSARRFLSHEDALLVMPIPKTFKYFGVILLENNIDIKGGAIDDKELVILYARKYRL